MATAPRLWPGSAIACVASGPSLVAADVNQLRDRVRVIAVNDGVRLAPWADVLYSSDRAWWAKKIAPTFSGLRFSIGSKRRHADAIPGQEAITVLTNTGDSGLELQPSGLKTGKNSGAAAINLAIHLGALRILLLGYDLSYHGRRSHFFDESSRSYAPYSMFVPFFERMCETLKTQGVTVINCSRRTSLTCFPKMDLADALAEIATVAA